MAETINVLSTNKSGVDFRELRQLTKDFKGWKPDKQLHKMLRTAGQMIADDAKAIISPHSQSIPPTIKVRVSKTRVSVVAGGAAGQAALARAIFTAGYGTPEADRAIKHAEREGAGAAIAGLYELGNKGGSKSQAATRRGTFRHPVFGNRGEWVEQKRQAFLLPAAEDNRKRIEVLEGRAVADAFREFRFPVS